MSRGSETRTYVRGVTDGLPERVNFFEGQLLGPDDLRAEQDYHRRMRYLHNRLHGWGIAQGFAVEADGGDVVVGPGVAIDSLGREIVLHESAHLALPPEAVVHDQTRWYVVATWEEAPCAPVPHGDGTAFSRWVERCALVVSPVAPDDAGQAVLVAIVDASAGTVAGIDMSRRRALTSS